MADRDIEAAEGRGSLLGLAALSLIVGAGAGLVGALFLLALKRADDARNALIAWAHGGHVGRLAGFALVVSIIAAAAALAASLVRRFSPAASGSGIPQVEAALHGELRQAPFRLIPIKFTGGLLAIGSGLALGREGPSIQMGASFGHLVGRAFRRSWPDCRVLLAAGAGAGLATAFNAPIAGAVFVLEELVQQFEPRIAIAALGASATAISFSRMLLGDRPDFHVDALAYAVPDRRGRCISYWAWSPDSSRFYTTAHSLRRSRRPIGSTAGRWKCAPRQSAPQSALSAGSCPV